MYSCVIVHLKKRKEKTTPNKTHVDNVWHRKPKPERAVDRRELKKAWPSSKESLCSANGSNNTPRCIQKLYHDLVIIYSHDPRHNIIMHFTHRIFTIRASGNAGGLQRSIFFFFISLLLLIFIFLFFQADLILSTTEPR